MEDETSRPAGGFLKELLAQTPDLAFIEVAADGTIIDWAGASKALFGWSAQEAKGRRFGLIFTEQDRKAGTDLAELEVAAIRGRSEDDRWHLRRDGGLFWGSGVTQSIRDDSGALRGFCKFVRDRTDLRTQIRHWENRALEAEHGLAALQESLSALARQLQGPAPESAGSATLDRALPQRLLTQLSELMPARPAATTTTRVKLQDTLATEIGRIEADRRLRSGTLQLVVPATPLHVNADRSQLAVLLHELAANALDMSAAEEVTVSMSIEGSSAVIRFDNDGQGLGPSELQSVFLLLSGTAISQGALPEALTRRLTRIRSLAQAQGALVEIRSLGLKAGSTFSLRLPVLPPNAADWDAVDAAMLA